MDKNRSIYAIYKYDFHKATEPLIQTRADGIDGAKYLKQAQKCFESLFDQNTIDGLRKISHDGDASRLPNDVLQKVGDIIMWRVNNSQMKDVWTRRGKDCNGIDRYEPDKVESNPYCNVLIDKRPGKCLMAIEKSAAWSSKPDGLRDILLENFNSASHSCRIRFFIRYRHEKNASFQSSFKSFLCVLFKKCRMNCKSALHVSNSSSPEPFSGFQVCLCSFVHGHLCQFFFQFFAYSKCPRLGSAVLFCRYYIKVSAHYDCISLVSL